MICEKDDGKAFIQNRHADIEVKNSVDWNMIIESGLASIFESMGSRSFYEST